MNGKLFALAELHRRLQAMGVQVGKDHLSRIFSELPHQRVNPSFNLFKSIAQALGLSLDDTNALIEKIRGGDCRRVGI